MVSELDEIRRRVRNIWGAISSSQVADKDVEGQAKLLLEYIDALRASLPTKPVQVGVKELEWTECNSHLWRSADLYRIEDNGANWTHDRYWLFIVATRTKHSSLEAAKAAAQADYEQRIRSAFTPAQPANFEQAVEALGRFGHHPDPAIDFEVEVESIESELINIRNGFENGTPSIEEIKERICRAMEFRVGAVESAVSAKSRLRELERAALPMLGAGQEKGDLQEAFRRRARAALEAAAKVTEARNQVRADGGCLKRSDECAREFGEDAGNDSDRDGTFNWGWPLTEIEPLEPPLPARGAQGLWDWQP